MDTLIIWTGKITLIFLVGATASALMIFLFKWIGDMWDKTVNYADYLANKREFKRWREENHEC